MLEELLENYKGTVFLVSHDRAFLDNVVTSLIAYEGASNWREYEGGIQDWLVQSRRAGKSISSLTSSESYHPSLSNDSQTRSDPSPSISTTGLKKKLGYKEQRELDGLPNQIETLEIEQKKIAALIEDGSIFSSDPRKANDLLSRSTQIESELIGLLERWEILSAKS